MYDNIIVVGNGEGVLENKNGKEIDKFDTVVRLGTYITEGYEEFVGSRTDIISTIYWKLNIERLKTTKVILSVPLIMQEQYFECEKYVVENYNDFKENILYLNKEEDLEGIKNMYLEKMKPLPNMDEVNFSLGFKTFYFLRKLFPHKKIYTTGFDFFKTSWYWNKDHNRNDANRHPYIKERIWFKKMLVAGELYEI